MPMPRPTLSGIALLAAMLACACAWAAPVIDDSTLVTQELPNGLDVIVREVPGSGLVAAGFAIRASVLYESEQERGLSDIVRHMMLDVPGPDGMDVTTSVGDTGAIFDSHTSLDSTQIRLVAAADAFYQLLPRFVKTVFEPVFDEAVWAQQLPELRRNLLDAERRPLGRHHMLLWEAAFPNHPYGRPVAGTATGVAAYSADALAAFHKKYYVPNNMSLLVVGDVKSADVLAAVAELAGGYASHTVDVPAVTPAPRPTDSRTRLEKAAIRGTIISYAWHGAGIDNKRDVCTLDLIYALLGEGSEARLDKALEADAAEGVVPQVEFITRRDPGLFIITLLCQPEAELTAREIVADQMQRLQDEPITEQELQTARKTIHAGYAFDNQTFAGQVGSMGFYEAIDTYRFAVDYLAEVDKVTVEDIRRVAGEYLDPNKSTLVIIRPRKPGDATKEARLIP